MCRHIISLLHLHTRQYYAVAFMTLCSRKTNFPLRWLKALHIHTANTLVRKLISLTECNGGTTQTCHFHFQLITLPMSSRSYIIIWQYQHTSQFKHTPLDAIIVGYNHTFELNRGINFKSAVFGLCHNCIQWAIYTSVNTDLCSYLKIQLVSRSKLSPSRL